MAQSGWLFETKLEIGKQYYIRECMEEFPSTYAGWIIHVSRGERLVFNINDNLCTVVPQVAIDGTGFLGVRLVLSEVYSKIDFAGLAEQGWKCTEHIR